MPTQGSKVFFFGDSLTDVGVIFDALVEALTEQILADLISDLGPDPTPEEIDDAEQQAATLALQQALVEAEARGIGPQKAVTNEFTHATYFGDASGAHVVNFANAGARALGTQEPFGDGTGYDSNLNAQLDRFADSLEGPVAQDSKAVVFIGANDFSDIIGEAFEAPDASLLDLIGAAEDAVNSLLDALEASARTLDDAGVGTIFFGTLPVGTFFPAAEELDDLNAGLADIIVSVYNGLLTDRADALQSEGIDVRMIDYAAVARAIANDASAFGIVADKSDLLIDTSSFDSDQVGFWDPIHPAEAVHQAWGAYADFVMDGGSTASLSDFGNFSIQTNGANAVFANGGNDTVFALGGDDIVIGGTGEDAVYAGSGNDIVSGGAADDLLRGQAGNDLIDGGSGDDIVQGGAGDDVLLDGLGSDLVRGGRGDDVLIFVQGTLEGDDAATQDDFRGGSGDDALYLVLDSATFDAFAQNGATDTLADLGISTRSIETIVAIDGREGVESVLGGFEWFQDGDYWGLIPAPTQQDLIV